MPIFVGTGNSTFLSASNTGKGVAVGIGTTTTAGRNAGVGTATGTIIYNATDNAIQVWAGSSWNTVSSAFVATGGNVQDGTLQPNNFKYHTFTSSGAFTISSGTKNVEVMVIGAGGGGGSNNQAAGSDGGAGGGGGGVVLATVPNLGPGTYNITVGSGGAGGTAGTGTVNTNPVNQQAGICSPSKAAPYNGFRGNPGGDSVFAASSPTAIKLTAKGGGGGGSGPNAGNEDCGGSGGGAGSGGSSTTNGGPALQPSTNSAFTGTLTTNAGFAGGNAPSSTPFSGAGGGGAGGAGTNGSGGTLGTGGPAVTLPADWTAPLIGIPSLNPVSRQYGAGGGGGDGGPSYPGNVAPGGSGGGGSGATQNVNANSGLANGSGGGGGAGVTGQPDTDPNGSGGSGGAGMVVIRYAL